MRKKWSEEAADMEHGTLAAQSSAFNQRLLGRSTTAPVLRTSYPDSAAEAAWPVGGIPSVPSDPAHLDRVLRHTVQTGCDHGRDLFVRPRRGADAARRHPSAEAH